MALPRPHIMVLAEMVKALDKPKSCLNRIALPGKSSASRWCSLDHERSCPKPPKTDKQIDAAVEYWRGREREMEHRSAIQLDLSVLMIDRREIMQIMELKHFRNEQHEKKKQRGGDSNDARDAEKGNQLDERELERG